MGKQNRPLLGAVMMIGGALAFPVGDAAAKHLAEAGISPLWLSWARIATGGLLLWPFLLRAYFRGHVISRLDLLEQSIRALLIALATVLFISALAYVPLADVVGAYSAAPIVAAILAVLVLKEPFSNRKMAAVLIGFIGMMLIIRPSVTMNIGYLQAMGAGFCMGAFVVATRWAKTDLPPMAVLALQTGIGMTMLLPFAWPYMGAFEWAIMPYVLVMGGASAVANYLTIRALRFAPAGLLAPLIYVEIIGAVALGYWLFGDLPSLYTWLGIGIIVAAGLLLVERKPRAHRL